MINSKYASRATALLVFLPMLLPGQQAHEDLVPLKNWATPLYWHPNRAQRAAAASAAARNAGAPQVEFSDNTVSMEELSLVAITPCRLVDTRGITAGFSGLEPFSGPPIASSATVTFPVQSAIEASTTAPSPCGVIPSIAAAYSLNVTVVPQAGGPINYLSILPAGPEQPAVSTINDLQGLVVANAAIVPAGVFGGLSVFNSGPTAANVVIDMNGFFTSPTNLNGDTSLGAGVLSNNTSGSYNTGSGANVLYANTTGGYNTASGANVLYSNTTGGFNTASGDQALENNTVGSVNTASGASALFGNTTGSNNTAIGYLALENNSDGNNNIALGSSAAVNAPADNSNSIYLGSPGSANDSSGTIQLGTAGTHLSFFVAGVSQTATGLNDAVPVMIDSNGQMGTNVSAQLLKEDIQDMGEASTRLLRLRPVTFRYHQAYKDGSKSLDYGLIAEQVAEIYPDLVVKAKDGRILAVQYQKLTPMLLNEVRKQAEKIRSLEDRLATLETLLPAAPRPAR
ncbi:MAG: tail fiber domain-containing protein [Bryobacteraceae bacterium]